MPVPARFAPAAINPSTSAPVRDARVRATEEFYDGGRRGAADLESNENPHSRFETEELKVISSSVSSFYKLAWNPVGQSPLVEINHISETRLAFIEVSQAISALRMAV
jgi:hypothetical protein